MNKKVTVIDYGVGNLLSVARALEHCESEVKITSNPGDISSASYLVLPGVGAFKNGMDELNKRGLADPIIESIHSEKPFLGICLGMQLLVTVSEEFGDCNGLNIIPGKVKEIPNTDINNEPHKIPHIGWNRMYKPSAKVSWDGTMLDGVSNAESVYFVHSYTVFPEDDEYRLADVSYNGRQIAAVIQSDNVIGCQFHPEKSGKTGLQILGNFLNL